MNNNNGMAPALPSPVSGAVTIPNMEPNTSYNLEYWDTTTGQVILTQNPDKKACNPPGSPTSITYPNGVTVTQDCQDPSLVQVATSDTNGNLIFTTPSIQSDLALKISLRKMPNKTLAVSINPVHPITYSAEYPLTGTKTASMTEVLVNNTPATVDNTANTWSSNVTLNNIGDNTITIVGKDSSGVSSNPLTLDLKRHKPADANGDGNVDTFDFSLLATAWNKDPSSGSNYLSDFNEDGSIDTFDFSLLATNWGK